MQCTGRDVPCIYYIIYTVAKKFYERKWVFSHPSIVMWFQKAILFFGWNGQLWAFSLWIRKIYHIQYEDVSINFKLPTHILEWVAILCMKFHYINRHK